MSPESYARVMDAVADRLYAALGSDNPYVVFGVVMAVDVLVSVQSGGEFFEDTSRNCCIRFVSFLRIVFQTKSLFELPSRDNESQSRVTEDDFWNLIIMSKAAIAMGHVAREGEKKCKNIEGAFQQEIMKIV